MDLIGQFFLATSPGMICMSSTLNESKDISRGYFLFQRRVSNSTLYLWLDPFTTFHSWASFSSGSRKGLRTVAL